MTYQTLRQMRQLDRQGKLGFLGRHVLCIADDYTLLGEGFRKQGQVLEYLKNEDITMEFARVDTSLERGVQAEVGAAWKPMNFRLYVAVKGSRIQHIPVDFQWNGSFEGLDFEMKQDVETLKKLGFDKIDYRGYNGKTVGY